MPKASKVGFVPKPRPKFPRVIKAFSSGVPPPAGTVVGGMVVGGTVVGGTVVGGAGGPAVVGGVAGTVVVGEDPLSFGFGAIMVIVLSSPMFFLVP
jgi:hypothetical protein